MLDLRDRRLQAKYPIAGVKKTQAMDVVMNASQDNHRLFLGCLLIGHQSIDQNLNPGGEKIGDHLYFTSSGEHDI